MELNENEVSSVYQTVKETSVPVEELPETATVDIGYSCLKLEEEQELYRRIGESITHIADEPDENGNYSTERIRLTGMTMTQESIRHALNAYTFDHPQVFWLRNLFGYACSDEETIVECYSVMSAEDCNEKSELLAVSVGDILKGITPEMSPYDKEKYIHDRVLAGCTYKHNVASMSDGWEYFSVFGALVKGEAVCEGYAKSIQLLLNLSGMECCTIRGTADSVEHMWNVVKIDDSWYHMDPTWDDKEDLIGYEYFNITTDDIEINHIIAPRMEENGEGNAAETESRNFFVPDCSSRFMNYYNVEALRLTGLEGKNIDRMIEFMYGRAMAKEVYLPLFILPSMDYNECIEQMFYARPFKFYYFIDEVNKRLNNGFKIDRESIRILKNEKNNTLRIRVNYIPA